MQEAKTINATIPGKTKPSASFLLFEGGCSGTGCHEDSSGIDPFRTELAHPSS